MNDDFLCVGRGIGHTCGVRVDGPLARGFLRFLSLTAFQAEGCGSALRAQIIKKGRGFAAGCVEGLCSLRSGGDSGPAAEGCGGALQAQIIKSRPASSVISTEAKRSGEISLLNSPGSIGAGDLSTQSIIGAVTVCPIPARSPARDDERAVSPYRHVKKGGAAGAGVFVRQDAEKKKPLISRSFFFISEEIRIHSSGIRMLRHRSRYRCLWSLRRSCIRRGVLRS